MYTCMYMKYAHICVNVWINVCVYFCQNIPFCPRQHIRIFLFQHKDEFISAHRWICEQHVYIYVWKKLFFVVGLTQRVVCCMHTYRQVKAGMKLCDACMCSGYFSQYALPPCALSSCFEGVGWLLYPLYLTFSLIVDQISLSKMENSSRIVAYLPNHRWLLHNFLK